MPPTPVAPIALFAYKRPDTVRAVVTSLLRNALAAETELHVFADGPKPWASLREKRDIAEVRDFLKGIRGFSRVIIHESPSNKGLANSIIGGVTAMLRDHPSVIVVEDDLVVNRHFLEYMNDGLAMYARDPEVVSIHGYVHPAPEPLPETFFIKGADCWGWATWADAWNLFEPDALKLLQRIREQGRGREFDMDGRVRRMQLLELQACGKADSWAIRWDASAFVHDRLTLHPGRSLVRNIGFGPGATNTKSVETGKAQTLAKDRVRVERLPLREDPDIRRLFGESHD